MNTIIFPKCTQWIMTVTQLAPGLHLLQCVRSPQICWPIRTLLNRLNALLHPAYKSACHLLVVVGVASRTEVSSGWVIGSLDWPELARRFWLDKCSQLPDGHLSPFQVAVPLHIDVKFGKDLWNVLWDIVTNYVVCTFQCLQCLSATMAQKSCRRLECKSIKVASIKVF